MTAAETELLHNLDYNLPDCDRDDDDDDYVGAEGRTQRDERHDLKLLRGMTGLCINESRQQQIGRSAHHLESFICDCFFQRLVRLAMCAKQSTRPPRATNDTTHTTTNIKHMCAEMSKILSRISCLAVAPMFHRLVSWERPQSSWGVQDDDRAAWNVEQELDVPEDVGDTFADYLSTAFLKGKLSAKTVCEIAWYGHNAGD